MAKDNEIQSLHSKLTDTMVSKQQLEQRMLQLMEAEQKRASAEDSMQMQVQVLLLKCLKSLVFSSHLLAVDRQSWPGNAALVKFSHRTKSDKALLVSHLAAHQLRPWCVVL